MLGLPRGGVPVAYEIALALEAPLDVLVVRKLGIPGYEEVGMGAIATGGIHVVDRQLARQLGVTASQLRGVIERESTELARREQLYRGDRPPLDVAGKTVVVVDDGLATGSTMLAAITALRVRTPASIVVAVPVGAPAVVRSMRTHVDDLHCLLAPDAMEAVGEWYEDFTQTSDEEVRTLLRPFTEVRHGIPSPGHHQHRVAPARRAQ